MPRNKQQDAERHRIAYHKNKEKHRLYMRKYYHEHKEAMRASARRSIARHHGKVLAGKKRWYLANRERLLAKGREYSRKKRQGDPEWKKQITLRWADKVRREVLAAYGGKCACCGEASEEFLTIDHINGRGNEERREFGRATYVRLRKLGFPKDNYRLLCMNCNFSIGRKGYCPHQNKLLVVA
jgi:hypothetical protein